MEVEIPRSGYKQLPNGGKVCDNPAGDTQWGVQWAGTWDPQWLDSKHVGGGGGGSSGMIRRTHMGESGDTKETQVTAGVSWGGDWRSYPAWWARQRGQTCHEVESWAGHGAAPWKQRQAGFGTGQVEGGDPLGKEAPVWIQKLTPIVQWPSAFSYLVQLRGEVRISDSFPSSWPIRTGHPGPDLRLYVLFLLEVSVQAQQEGCWSL